MKVILIGYMGSGKSSVGKILAGKLEIPFTDLDEEIEEEAGMSIPEIFAGKGAVYFRRLERELVAKRLAGPGSFVMAAGGGTPCYGNTMELIRETPEAVSVYLKTTVPVLSQRLFPEKENRPLLAHLNSENELKEFIGIHLFERSGFYEQASLVVDASVNSPEEIAGTILRKLL